MPPSARGGRGAWNLLQNLDIIDSLEYLEPATSFEPRFVDCFDDLISAGTARGPNITQQNTKHVFNTSARLYLHMDARWETKASHVARVSALHPPLAQRAVVAQVRTAHARPSRELRRVAHPIVAWHELLWPGLQSQLGRRHKARPSRSHAELHATGG